MANIRRAVPRDRKLTGTGGLVPRTAIEQRLEPRNIYPEYASSLTTVGLDFFMTYLETVFDALLPLVPQRALWCGDALKTFRRASAIRRTAGWEPRGCEPHTELKPQVPGHPEGQLVDEMVWNLGSYLNILYLTAPVEGLRGNDQPVAMSEDRYALCAGSLAFPLPTARSFMPLRSWRDFLRLSARRVFADVLLWLVSRLDFTVTRDDAVEHLSAALRVLMSRHESYRGANAFADPFRIRLVELFPLDIRTVDLLGLDAAIASAVEMLPTDVLRHTVLRASERRLDLLEDGLIRLLGAVSTPPDLDSRLFLNYIVEAPTRAAIEKFSANELQLSRTERPLDVALPIPAEIANVLRETGLGFRIVDTLPESPDSQNGQITKFALFEGIPGRSADAVVHRCKRSLAAAVAAAGLGDPTPERRGHGASYRNAGVKRWGFMGYRSGRPPETGTTRMAVGLLEQWAAVLRGSDDLGLRIQKAVIHIRRAEQAGDAADQLEESWRVLECLAGNAGQRGEGMLCYFPLGRLPGRFSEMSGRQRESLIHREYARHVACFRAFKRIRNKALAHREIIDIDWQVIEQCAGPALAFSQRCLNTAIVAWDVGARDPKDVVRLLRNYLQKDFGVSLPSLQDIDRR